MQESIKVNPYTHRIYGRSLGKGRFKPLDLRSGKFVVNLMYATMLPEFEAERISNELNEENQDLEFVTRKI